MNVMLTCVGRRNYMVDFFKNAIAPNGKVIAVNSIDNTPGMLVADKSIISPPVNSKDYIPFVLKHAKENNVKLIVSLFDIDLTYLSRAKALFLKEGIFIAVSDEEIINICNDKFLTYKYLINNGFLAPRTFLSIIDAEKALSDGIINFPLIVKPRWGMGSISVFTAENIEEMRFFYHYAKKSIRETYLSILSKSDFEHSVMIQEYISGSEYGIDILNSLEGKYVSNVIKRKIAMRAGETDEAITEKNQKLSNIARKLGESLHHCGNLDVDLIIDNNENAYIIELNARFGGGYPFSHIAGSNYPKYLVDSIENHSSTYNFDYENGVHAVKGIYIMRR